MNEVIHNILFTLLVIKISTGVQELNLLQTNELQTTNAIHEVLNLEVLIYSCLYVIKSTNIIAPKSPSPDTKSIRSRIHIKDKKKQI